MVLDYYKLAEQPFGVTPDPRFLYMSPTHREALASAVYGVNAGRGFTALIAKPGMGKTTLLFDFLHIVRDHAKTVFLFQSQCSPKDLLRSLLEDLGVEGADGDFMALQRKLNECLLNVFATGKRLVVVIDEAQNLEAPVLEVVRMLSNFETPQQKLMHLILAGQPQLAEKLASPGLVQLRQRVSIIARLKPFDAEQTQQYIEHRLRIAGYDFKKPLFTSGALAMIAQGTEGIPRNISNVCFNAMSLGFVAKQRTIGTEVIQEVFDDLDLRPMFNEPEPESGPGKESRSEELPVSVAEFPLNSEKGSRFHLNAWSTRFAVVLMLLSLVSSLVIRSKAQSGAEFASVGSSLSTATIETSSSVAPVKLPEAPTPLAPDKKATPRTGEPQVRVVAPGETIYRICTTYFGSYDDQTLARFRKLNPWVKDPTRIRAGQQIRVPGSSVPHATGAGAEKP